MAPNSLGVEHLRWRAFARKSIAVSILGDFMAKRVSATELVWLITEALREEQGPHFATSLAIVSDEKVGWRSVIASPSRNRLNRNLLQKLAQVEESLRREYSLAN
jgi:hypothetical protein